MAMRLAKAIAVSEIAKSMACNENCDYLSL